jgi:hypothetical protein
MLSKFETLLQKIHQMTYANIVRMAGAGFRDFYMQFEAI